MHGYCSTYVFIHNFTPTDVGVFLVKMCISQHFFYFALTDASALMSLNICFFHQNLDKLLPSNICPLAYQLQYYRALGPWNSLSTHILGLWPKPRTRTRPRRRSLCQKRLCWKIERWDLVIIARECAEDEKVLD